MKKTIFLFILIINITAFSQAPKIITLNEPDTTRGSNTMKAFADRASQKDYDTTDLSLQDLSDLIWAANGFNRTDTQKRTAPSAINAQDIDIYAFMKNGVYLYNAFDNDLELVVEGDYRDIIAGQQHWVKEAPVICVLISDISKFKHGTHEQQLTWAAFDAGIVSQNISIYCASVGLATRPRASMDNEKIIKTLNLKDSQYPMLNNPVAYPKE